MRALCSIGWPALATLGSLSLLISQPLAMRLLGLGEQELEGAKVLRLLFGSTAYFSAAWLAMRIVSLLLSRDSRKGRARSPKLLKDIFAAIAFVAAALATIALVFEGSVLGAAATSGAIVAVVGFSLRGVMADIFAGIALGLERTYRIGDWIELESGIGGRVAEITWRATRMETRDKVQVIVPNGRIAQQRITNYSAPRPQYRQQIRLTLDHSLPAADAKLLLTEAAAFASGILTQPPPDARLVAHEPDGLVYVVRYWVPSFAQEIDCRDAILTAADNMLRRRAAPTAHRRHQLRIDFPDGQMVADAAAMLKRGPEAAQ